MSIDKIIPNSSGETVPLQQQNPPASYGSWTPPIETGYSETREVTSKPNPSFFQKVAETTGKIFYNLTHITHYGPQSNRDVPIYTLKAALVLHVRAQGYIQGKVDSSINEGVFRTALKVVISGLGAIAGRALVALQTPVHAAISFAETPDRISKTMAWNARQIKAGEKGSLLLKTAFQTVKAITHPFASLAVGALIATTGFEYAVSALNPHTANTQSNYFKANDLVMKVIGVFSWKDPSKLSVVEKKAEASQQEETHEVGLADDAVELRDAEPRKTQ